MSTATPLLCATTRQFRESDLRIWIAPSSHGNSFLRTGRRGGFAIPTPTVSVPPDLNIAQVAEAGLQLAGMKADEAHAFCQTMDWTSTLVIPIPRDVTSYQTEEVDGVQGTLISLPGWGTWLQPGYTLLWVKNGIIYSLTGYGSSADAVPLAESLD